MNRLLPLVILTLFAALLAGCALGNKAWPNPVKEQDRFSILVVSGERSGPCLTIVVRVVGAMHRFSEAGVQLEPVGSLEGQGCNGCPFMPRSAEFIKRGDQNFQISGDTVTLSICTLDEGVEYRFRVIGKNELNDMGSTFTNVYVAEP